MKAISAPFLSKITSFFVKTSQNFGYLILKRADWSQLPLCGGFFLPLVINLTIYIKNAYFRNYQLISCMQWFVHFPRGLPHFA